MCGIAGIIHTSGAPVAPKTVKFMTDAIAHRGPDGEGLMVDGAFGLGHRRLAIIDLSDAAAQPMASEDGRYVISYNGEVYNFRELRKELESDGWSFRSNSDTEVVLKAFIAWGAKAIKRFNGMFAFAILDRKERRLLLARDRYGIKPLYYAQHGATFLFGSEIKALAANPAFQRELDLHRLAEYLTFQNIFTDGTLYRHVHLLKPGHALLVEADGSQTLSSYWDYHFEQTSAARKSPQEYCVELDALFEQAVRRQLVSDVDIGAYLSGGMDSGSITAVAASHRPGLQSFTCGFDVSSASGIELSFDERTAAEAMSAHFNTEHYEVVLKAGDMQRALPAIVHHMEEPRVGQCYPNFYVAKLASKFVKVVLGGTGGDEIFGGYPWRYYRAARSETFDEYVDEYYAFWQRLVPSESFQALLAPVWGEVKDVDTRAIMHDVFHTHANQLRTPEDYVNHSLYFEAKTFLPGLLMVEDKLSMAHSLESRVPFLDNDLVDFAMRLPVDMKLRDLESVIKMNENELGQKRARYFQRTNDGKLLLREMIRRHVPSDVAEREKQGFSAPDASWFKGQSIDYVRDRLYRKNARIYDVLDPKTTQALVDEHLSGRTNRRLLIWSLLYLEEFLGGCEESGIG